MFPRKIAISKIAILTNTMLESLLHDMTGLTNLGNTEMLHHVYFSCSNSEMR